ncbi:hypothetical protein FQZ97_545340 [compost metagenome]
MCSISVEPMPSMISQPKCALKRCAISPGNASPADEHMRSATASRAGSLGEASMPAKPVGAPKNTVGLCSVQRRKVASGVGRSAISTTVAPTDSGKVSALPRPYAKYILAAEKHTSPSVRPSTGLP